MHIQAIPYPVLCPAEANQTYISLASSHDVKK